MNKIIEVNSLLPEIEEAPEGETYIYILFLGQACVYVGQSSALRERVYQHLVGKKEFDRVEYSLCKQEDANTNEADAIVDLRPALNKMLPPTDKYINKAEFKRLAVRAISVKDEIIVFSTHSTEYMRVDDAERLIEEIGKMTFGAEKLNKEGKK
jgi:excinuclease UvrABC nuclease subunit